MRDKVKDRTEKKCCRCRVVLPLAAFSVDARKPDGKAGWCKECHYAHRKTEKGVAAQRRYEASAKGKAAAERRLKKLRSDPLKYTAHKLVQAAVASGVLVPAPCVECGATPTVGHHEDYTKPLDVVWLCPRCHVSLHARRNEGG